MCRSVKIPPARHRCKTNKGVVFGAFTGVCHESKGSFYSFFCGVDSFLDEYFVLVFFLPVFLMFLLFLLFDESSFVSLTDTPTLSRCFLFGVVDLFDVLRADLFGEAPLCCGRPLTKFFACNS